MAHDFYIVCNGCKICLFEFNIHHKWSTCDSKEIIHFINSHLDHGKSFFFVDNETLHDFDFEQDDMKNIITIEHDKFDSIRCGTCAAKIIRKDNDDKSIVKFMIDHSFSCSWPIYCLE